MDTWNRILWRQFGAAIDTLENTVRACPDDLWRDRSRRPEYWAAVHHTVFFLDYYLSASPRGFAPPAPFTLSELDERGVLPERVYERSELIDYLEHARRKCRARIETLSDEDLTRPCGFERRDLTVVELVLYCLRHVQHHAAQLNLILRQVTDTATPWVDRAREP